MLPANHAYAATGGLDGFPVKPVRMVVPLALAARWSQAVVVDNRPGAGGTIGNEIVAKSASDGYTLLLFNSTMAISPALYRNAAADIIRDSQPVTLTASQPSIIAVHPAVPAKSLKEQIALMKS